MDALMRGRTTIVIAHRRRRSSESTASSCSTPQSRRAGHACRAARAAVFTPSCTGSSFRRRPRSLAKGVRIVHTEASLGWGGQEIRI
jgi:hypothetical protein